MSFQIILKCIQTRYCIKFYVDSVCKFIGCKFSGPVSVYRNLTMTDCILKVGSKVFICVKLVAAIAIWLAD